jgi:hypothetical protein
MRKIEEEIFVANSRGDVKALGIKVSCAPTDLHIHVNSVDVTKNVVLEEIRVVIAREQQQTAVMVTPQK